jgi:hypothetical protein
MLIEQAKRTGTSSFPLKFTGQQGWQPWQLNFPFEKVAAVCAICFAIANERSAIMPVRLEVGS